MPVLSWVSGVRNPEPIQRALLGSPFHSRILGLARISVNTLASGWSNMLGRSFKCVKPASPQLQTNDGDSDISIRKRCFFQADTSGFALGETAKYLAPVTQLQ